VSGAVGLGVDVGVTVDRGVTVDERVGVWVWVAVAVAVGGVGVAASEGGGALQAARQHRDTSAVRNDIGSLCGGVSPRYQRTVSVFLR
jgi:hypothetical protein